MFQAWQEKLSERNVASMPWDPPAAAAQTHVPVNQNTVRPPAQSLPAPVPNPTPVASTANGVQIKSEPGIYDLQNLPPQAPLPNNYPSGPALQRAGQALQAKFGDAASQQVNALQARAAAHAQPTPVGMPEEQRRIHEQRARLMAQQRAQAQAAAISSAQTDGADDWQAMVAERHAEADMARAQFADFTLKQRVEQMQHGMEGGGLMLPTAEHRKLPVPKSRKANAGHAEHNSLAESQAAQSSSASVPRIPQVDGNDSDEIKGEGDEDAINSDLDDSEDDAVEETDEDGNNGELMLCTYDKVQRVKNKWKCTLKDGVLSTGGKE